MHAVLMTLSAPLRSWGGAAVGDARPSEWAPTQAAVIGLVGAMVGLRRGDPAVADFYAGYDVWAVSGPKSKKSTSSEPGGLAYDFQTIANSVGGDGKVRSEAIVSRRGYLADWLDVVALVPTSRAPVDVDVIADRATSPSFPLYLGRKAFPLGDALDPILVEADAEGLARQLWARWVAAGGDPEQGSLWTPSGKVAELEGFRGQRERRPDVRNHYGFAERTVNIWRPVKKSMSASVDMDTVAERDEGVMAADRDSLKDHFDMAWEPTE